MNETSEANIKQILTSFDTAIAIYENPSHWSGNVSVEDIKTAFKLGKFIEKTIKTFTEKNASPALMHSFTKWRESKNKTHTYTCQFYATICDSLLLKFFQNQTTNDKTLDAAVRMYTTLFPKERFKEVVKKIILDSATSEAIFDFSLANKPLLNTEKMRYKSILENWCLEINNGNIDKIKIVINDSLSSFKVENTLQFLIGVLVISESKQITEIILENLLENMKGRSVLHKKFWMSLFRNVNKEDLRLVCIKHRDFLVSLSDFLIYVGSMMEKNQNGDWITNPNICFCPDIGYDELVAILKLLCQLDVKDYVMERLDEAKKVTELLIWAELRSSLD